MSCSKILPELTYDIIKHFQNDFPTLHSCILVNRLWCRLAIPLLWENPFSIPTRNYNFFKIYLRNNDLKKKLGGYGVDYDSLSSNNTLFNYLKFLKYLNTWKIISSIERWFVENLKPKNKDLNSVFNLKRLVHKSIFEILIENEVNLHTFEIEIIGHGHSYSYFDDIFKLILQNTNFIYNIENLNIHSGYSANFISNELIKNHMLQLIKLHQNLKKISCYSNYYYNLYQSLLLSKDYNYSSTLTTIILYRVNLNGIIGILELANALDSVHIIKCYHLNSRFVQQIINLAKPFRLKSLFIDVTLKIRVLRSLLRHIGNYLENFGFDTKSISFLDSSLFSQKLLELITKYCKNIKILDFCGFESQITDSMFNLIKNYKHNLNYLSIVLPNRNATAEYSSIVLQNLGQTLPFKLEYLNLSFHIKINDFKIFLKNTQDTFIKKLLIYNEKGQNILPSVKKYIMKKKRVKYLSIYNSHFNNDLISLKDDVKEFRLYNIVVKSYYNLLIDMYEFIKEID
ncbi:hypothetical protein RclHR1_08330007 [Rhizophagus clarus]|uniref:F-box domain-containing protein n=1 Tax=Rhizophagus clarus TaxID=94130 RepID=A0A2Z6S0M8_9GLOM|nr:hypothetical protein RclHR1_08330007 [Rhizophagus clarus]GES72737.1 hypothetical protein GLOIN_2v1881853 [Rhizophagus clarus]